MAITGINNSSYTSYYASGYKNTVKKAACDIQKTKENSQVSKTEESQEDYVKKLLLNTKELFAAQMPDMVLVFIFGTA